MRRHATFQARLVRIKSVMEGVNVVDQLQDVWVSLKQDNKYRYEN